MAERKRAAAEKSRPAPGPGVWVITLFSFLLMYVPLVTLIILSFRANGAWTLEWYAKLATDQPILQACGLSLFIAFISTTISCTIGTMAAYAMSRFRWPGRQAFSVLTHFPLIMPEIVMGLASLVWFVALRITLGTFSVILAHVTFSVSYVILNVLNRLEELDPSLDEAARDLGASRVQTFWRVTFPLLRPAIASGGVMAFTLSFDDFLITFFVSGAGADTLPLKIYSMIKFGVSPEINALSTLLLVATIIIVLAVSRLGGKSKWGMG